MEVTAYAIGATDGPLPASTSAHCQRGLFLPADLRMLFILFPLLRLNDAAWLRLMFAYLIGRTSNVVPQERFQGSKQKQYVICIRKKEQLDQLGMDVKHRLLLDFHMKRRGLPMLQAGQEPH